MFKYKRKNILSNVIFTNILSSFANAKEQIQSGVNQVNPGSSTTPTGDELYSDVQKILNFIFGAVGILAAIMIIYGGVMMMLSAGDPGKNKKAKDTIVFGVIGLIVVLLAFTIVNFVLSLF